MDLFCLFLLILSFGLFYGFYLLKRVLLLSNAIIIIPAFGEIKRIPFDTIKKMLLIKKEKRVKSRNVITAEIKMELEGEEVQIGDSTNNNLELIDHILHHFSPEIVEIKDTTITSKV